MSDKKNLFNQAALHLKGSKNCVLVVHFNPDGDAIGSQSAAGEHLKNLGINTTMIVPNEPPATIRNIFKDSTFLDYSHSIAEANAAIDSADTIICLDFNELSTRVGPLLGQKILGSKSFKIMIDHHPAPALEQFDIVISDTTSSSTAYLTYQFIVETASTAALTPTISSALYVGIISDTGNWSYGNLTPELFRAAATLQEHGAEPVDIYSKLYYTQSASRLKLTGYALSEKMCLMPAQNAAYISLTVAELNRFSYKSGDTEGLVNMPMAIDGIEIAALFTETAECIKISLRSRSKNALDVNKFARTYFTGGGHKNAAGAKSFDTMANTEKIFIEAIKKEKAKLL